MARPGDGHVEGVEHRRAPQDGLRIVVLSGERKMKVEQGQHKRDREVERQSGSKHNT